MDRILCRLQNTYINLDFQVHVCTSHWQFKAALINISVVSRGQLVMYNVKVNDNKQAYRI